MFTKEQEDELRQLHLNYVTVTNQNYPNTRVYTFPEVIINVENNAPDEETDIYSLVKNVLNAMIYTSSNSVEEMIERAEADFPRRFQEMTPEQQAVVSKYRIPYEEMKKRFPLPGEET